MLVTRMKTIDFTMENKVKNNLQINVVSLQDIERLILLVSSKCII